MKKQNKKKKRRFLYLMKKIYALLEGGDIKIAICRMQIAGLSIYDDNFIYLNPSKDLLPTLIHECLHYLIETGKLKRRWKKRGVELEVIFLENFCAKYLDHYHGIKLLNLLMINLDRRSKTGYIKYDVKIPINY